MIIPAVLLSILSIVVIFSSSPSLAIGQLVFVLVGVLIFAGLSRFDYRALRNMVSPFYLLILILLIVVFIIGVETRGALRWISIGPFNLQPSEFAKPLIILTLAYFWTNYSASWLKIILSFLIVLPIIGLVFKQPDLGTTLTLLFIWLIMLLGSNISLKKLITLLIFGLVLAPLGWNFLHDYQRQRFLSFLSPNQDPRGIGYNVIQSTIAVGSGGLIGRGLGRGTQSRLQFLPEFRTDFIFASIAEELGTVGSILVLSLYLAIFFVLAKSLLEVGDRFGELLIMGVAGMLFFQIVVNIGMNTGMLPITGITLPLLSYGGSSIVTTFFCLGLVSSVRKYGLKRREIDTFTI